MNTASRDLLFPGGITDVNGIKVGHHTDPRRPTGCTVLLCEQGAVAGVDVRGAAPGTRETDLLAPGNLVDRVHAVVLSGGSAFGLATADGVMRWLDERGHGLMVGPARVPIVPAAVLFDLMWGDARIRPDAQSGHAACATASSSPCEQGSVGAGTGATVGKMFGVQHAMKGGVGTASISVQGVTIAALVVVNAAGDVIDPARGSVVAGSRTADGRGLRRITASIAQGELPAPTVAGANTTLGVIATDAVLEKAQAQRLAMMGHDGLARTIDPLHTLSDGDTLFALGNGSSGRKANMSVLGPLAAEVTARAVLNAVRSASRLAAMPGIPAARDFGSL